MTECQCMTPSAVGSSYTTPRGSRICVKLNQHEIYTRIAQLAHAVIEMIACGMGQVG